MQPGLFLSNADSGVVAGGTGQASMMCQLQTLKTLSPPPQQTGQFQNGSESLGLSPNTGHLLNGNKEVCCGCGRLIEDRYLLRVMENSWHETCLICHICQEPLINSCFFKDRKFFCRMDYDKYYGTKCASCLQSVPANELIMRVCEQVYHLRCFVCCCCGHQLQTGDQFGVRDGQLLCHHHYERDFSLAYSPKHDWCTGYSPKSDDELSSLDDGDQDTPKGPKRPRTILTTSQRRKFKASFEINPKPCRKVRESLAAETGLSVRVVQVWFQNQRAKVKKIQRRQEQQNGGDVDKNKGSPKAMKNKKILKDDDSTCTDSTTNNNNSSDSTVADIPETKFSCNQLKQFDNPTDQPGLYSNPMLGNDSQNTYDGVVNMDSMESMSDDFNKLDSTSPHSSENAQNKSLSVGLIVNPIDKLYSMQDSYFTGDN